MKVFIVCLLLILMNTVAAQESADIIIKNGRILDGTGNSWYRADLAIKDGKIFKIGKLDKISATKIIDAGNRIISPGFIDVHTHIEDDEFAHPTADNFIYDGVTSVVTGNCGGSNLDVKKYLWQIDSLKPSINVATLIGHNTVRRAVMGTQNRAPSEEELKKMEALVEEAMRNGAVGLSTGLIYIPGTYSETPEIIRLAKVVSAHNGLYATHMRNESDSVEFAIAEALRIGKEAGLPVEISHFKVGGQQNWGKSKLTIAMIEKARKEGMEVTIDQYPYTASSTSIQSMLPEEVMSDGKDSITARLNRPEIKNYVVNSLLKSLKKRKLKHFSYAVVANHTADTSYNGKTIEEINLLKGRKHKAKEEALTIIDLVLAGGAQGVFHGMNEDDVKRIMRYPFNMFASDASIRIFGKGVPHPRGYGTNGRVLAKYVRDEKVITLEEAVRRMTSLPAQKFGLKDRGLIKEGMAADILVFDENKVQDQSRFDKPHAYTTGMEFVIVNGKIVVENGVHLGTRSGKALSPALYN